MIRQHKFKLLSYTNPPTSWLGTVTYTTMAPVSVPLPLLLPPASAAMAEGTEMPLWVAQRWFRPARQGGHSGARGQGKAGHMSG